MKSKTCTNLLLVSIFLFFQTRQVQTGFTDYVKTIGSYFTSKEPENDPGGEFIQRIPYEVSTVDERFISEAAKLTGVALSELDSCQQRVKYLPRMSLRP